MNWQPILECAARKRALATVNKIVAALPEPLSDESTDATLAGGTAGLAVLCAYLSRAGLDTDENAARFLEQAMRDVSAQPMHPSFHEGFTGITWTVEHLHEQLFEAGAEDVNETVDEVLAQYLSRQPWEEDYDLISGLAGFGVYALERMPSASAVKCLELIVARLAETAERNADGVTWLTSPHLLPERQRKECPQGYYNLGLAHGVPGVIALLGGVCAAGVAVEQARPLLDGAVSWLLQQKRSNGARSNFSARIKVGDDRRDDCRLAWCYGDAGVAAALFAAARAVNEAAWEREALEIAGRAASRPIEDAGVVDAGLCHGAAGLGHIFNRLFQATGENLFREAARYWFEQTLALRRKGQGIAGFSSFRLGDEGNESWDDEPGLLMGAAGIALALLAAATDVEPEWDRTLLISLPEV